MHAEAVASTTNGRGLVVATTDDTLSTAPGALRGQATLTINTRQAQRLFLGRPVKVKDGQQVHPGVIGVRRFATLVRQVIVGARADDPYADQCLIQLDQEFKSVSMVLAELLQHTEQRLTVRPAVDVTIAVSIDPIAVPLRFSNQYAYRAAYLVADYDQLAAAVLSAHHGALMPRVDCEKLINRGRHLARRVFSIPLRYRFSGACRQDLLQMTARGTAALEKYGPVPESILERTQVPDYGAVRLSDGSAIIDSTDDEGSGDLAVD